MQLMQLPWARATKRTPIKLKAVCFPLKIRQREVQERCDAWNKKGLGGDMGVALMHRKTPNNLFLLILPLAFAFEDKHSSDPKRKGW